MAGRKHKTSTSAIAGLPVTGRKDNVGVPAHEADPDGHRRVRHRTVDTLGLMLTNGSITREMHDAGRAFQAQFAIAHFIAVRCTSLLRVSGGAGANDLTDAQLDARHHVGVALDALGGLDSPAGSCVWHVVGLQSSIRQWAMRQGWSGRPIDEKQAQGILVAALGVLARQHGYRSRIAERRAEKEYS